MPSNFTPNDRAALASDLRTLFLYTENSGNTSNINQFSPPAGANSTYSFGIMQFDVGNNPSARNFLGSIGFTSSEISSLSQQGGLTSTDLNNLNAKLQANASALDKFTDNQIQVSINKLDNLISDLKTTNPPVANAILSDENLQLTLVDYDNQFSINGIGNASAPPNSMLAYLRGESVTETGGTLQLTGTPTIDDIQNYINNSLYGVNNPGSVERRLNDYNNAIDVINSGATPLSDTAPPDVENAFGITASYLQGDLTYTENSDGSFTVVGQNGSVTDNPNGSQTYNLQVEGTTLTFSLPAGVTPADQITFGTVLAANLDAFSQFADLTNANQNTLPANVEVEFSSDSGFSADIGEDGTVDVTAGGTGSGGGDPVIQVNGHAPAFFFHDRDFKIVAGEGNDSVDLRGSTGTNTLIAGNGNDIISVSVGTRREKRASPACPLFLACAPKRW